MKKLFVMLKELMLARKNAELRYLHLLCSFLMIGSALAQQTFTFSTAGATLANGPTQVELNNAYSSTNLSGSVTSNNGIQSFTIPLTRAYRIHAAAASGGTPTSYAANTGGLGARVSGVFNFQAGDVVQILVGQVGGASGGAGAGGGGSFVVFNNNLLVAAGGGGGGTSDNAAANGTTSTSGTNDYPGGSTPGGFNGTGGSACNVGGSGANHGGGGGGFLTNGATSTANSPGGGGFAFLNGGAGGTGNGIGGFGGGGGCTSITVGGGGGGGYSGGAGGQQVNYCTPGIGRSGGGGGGSYNAGTNQINASGVNAGDGYVVIEELCDVAIVPSANPMCIGSSVTLSSTAVTTLSWSTQGSPSTPSIVVSPTVTSSYSLSGIGSNNCQYTTMITLTVVALPQVSAISIPSLLCVGNSASLTAYGANTFTWSSNVTGTTALVNPAVSAVYSYTGTSAATGCKNTGTVAVNVNANTLSITGNTIGCSGDALALTANGGSNYVWSTGSPFASIVVYPVNNVTYTVSGTDMNNCTLSKTIAITVNPKPTVGITADKQVVCKNEPVTLTAAGASSYTWSNGMTSGNITVSFPIDIPYYFTVTGVSNNGCTATSSITLNVSKCVGIEDVLATNGFVQVYPNPTNGDVFLVFSEVLENQLEVIDVTGKILISKTLTGQKINLNISHLVNGVYYVKVSNEKGLSTSKIVKQ